MGRSGGALGRRVSGLLPPCSLPVLRPYNSPCRHTLCGVVSLLCGKGEGSRGSEGSTTVSPRRGRVPSVSTVFLLALSTARGIRGQTGLSPVERGHHFLQSAQARGDVSPSPVEEPPPEGTLSRGHRPWFPPYWRCRGGGGWGFGGWGWGFPQRGGEGGRAQRRVSGRKQHPGRSSSPWKGRTRALAPGLRVGAWAG